MNSKKKIEFDGVRFDPLLDDDLAGPKDLKPATRRAFMRFLRERDRKTFNRIQEDLFSSVVAVLRADAARLNLHAGDWVRLEGLPFMDQIWEEENTHGQIFIDRTEPSGLALGLPRDEHYVIIQEPITAEHIANTLEKLEKSDDDYVKKRIKELKQLLLLAPFPDGVATLRKKA